jgi:hypothetical protein
LLLLLAVCQPRQSPTCHPVEPAAAKAQTSLARIWLPLLLQVRLLLLPLYLLRLL